MAANMIDVVVWVLVDSDGQYVAREDGDAVAEAYNDDFGDIGEMGGFRKVKVTVTIPLPKVIEVAGKCEEVE